MLGVVENLCIFKQTFKMCQNCCDSGYSDYPAFLKTVAAHRIDYIDGFKKRQYELYDEQDTENTEFCRFCFDSGVLHASIGIWAPPLTSKLGHYTSYEQGYYGREATAAESGSNPWQDEGIQVGEHVAEPASGSRMGPGFFQSHKRTITIAAVSVAVVSAVSVSAVKLSRSGFSVKSLFHKEEVDTAADIPPAVSAEPTLPNDTTAAKGLKKPDTAHKPDAAKEKAAVTISSLPAHSPAPEPKKNVAPVAPRKKAESRTASVHHRSARRHHHGSTGLRHAVAKKKVVKKPVPAEDDVEEDVPAKTKPVTDKKAATTVAAASTVTRPTKSPTTTVAVATAGKPAVAKKPAAPSNDEEDDTESDPKPAPAKPAATKAKPAVPQPVAQAPKPAPAKPAAEVAKAKVTPTAPQPAPVSVAAPPPRPLDPNAARILDSMINAGVIPHPAEGRTFSFHTIDRYHHETSDAPAPPAATVIQFGRFPKGSDSLLSEADLFRMKKEDMIIMLNEIYARHHFKFKDVRLNDYFSQQEWYKAEFDDVSARLTDIEQKNITFIKKHLLP